MNHRSGLLLLVIMTILACQVVPTPPALRTTLSSPPTLQSEKPFASQIAPTQTSRPTVPEPTVASLIPGELSQIAYPSQHPFAEVNLPEWHPEARDFPWPIALPVPLSQVENLAVANGLTLRQRNMLSQNGFVIVHSQEPQFSDLRQRVSLFYGQPYFLTTDAAFHALKLTFDELVPALEREELHRRLIEVTRGTFECVQTYFAHVAGTGLEADTHLAATYLGVGLRLLDPHANVPLDMEELVGSQVKQIMAGQGLEESVLLPGFQDDFRLYRPTGHYANDAQLEAYFRGLTWLERVEFPVSQGSGASAHVNPIPMILTLALRQSTTPGGPAVEDWVRISETLDFLSGVSQSGGPGEYARVMDMVYGRMLTVLSLQDASQLEEFRSRLNDLPFPDTIPSFSGEQNGDRLSSWSFLGTRSQIDGLILNQLAAETLPDQNAPHLLPGGQELMSVLGAQVAFEAMKASGGEYRADPQMIAGLESDFDNRASTTGILSARELWLDTYQKLLAFSNIRAESALSTTWAPFTLDHPWDYKELNSALGSWAELQFDTPDFITETEELAVHPDQDSPSGYAYVEPNPLVFYQLAWLAFTAADGLKQHDLTGVFTATPDPNGLSHLLNGIFDLADRLQSLGDIAARELEGDPLGVEDYALIQAPLGPAENRALAALYKNPQTTPDLSSRWSSLLDPLPGIAAIDFSVDRILQVGIGGVDRIFVLVPLEGKVYIAQGGLFSYYEFSQTRDRQMTIESWRRLLIDNPPEQLSYVSHLYLLEGVPINVLAFRIGDRYRVLPAAGRLSLRLSPSVDARVVHAIYPSEAFELIEGPVRANGLNWWKIQVEGSSTDLVTGWIIESQDSFERMWEK